MTPEAARALAKGELVRISAESPALAGEDARVLEGAAFDVPLLVRFSRNGYRIGAPPFVVCAGGDLERDDHWTAAVAAEFVERP